MPPRDQIGERLSGLEAKVEGMDRYTHEKWHDLNNTLQPLIALPERLTRDVAKIQGIFDGKIHTVSKDFERSIMAAIEKALMPMSADIAELRADVEALKADRHQLTGGRRFAVWIVQTLIAAIGAVIAVLTLGKHQ